MDNRINLESLELKNIYKNHYCEIKEVKVPLIGALKYVGQNYSSVSFETVVPVMIDDSSKEVGARQAKNKPDGEIKNKCPFREPKVYKSIELLRSAFLKGNRNLIINMIKMGAASFDNLNEKSRLKLLNFAVSIDESNEMFDLIFEMNKDFFAKREIGSDYILVEAMHLGMAYENTHVLQKVISLPFFADLCNGFRSNCLLHSAMEYKNFEMVKKFVSLGADIFFRGLGKKLEDELLCLNWAIEDSTEEICIYILELLVEKVDAKASVFHKALGRANKVGKFNVYNLLESRINEDLNGEQQKALIPLHYSVNEKSLINLKNLLAQGYDVNEQDENGQTPLHLAVSLEFEVGLDELLACKNLDVNIQDNVGQTPLHLALNSKYRAGFYKLFARKDLDVNIKNNAGQTPMHLAVKVFFKEVIKVLLTHRDLDINIEDSKGQTPLHYAVLKKSGGVQIVRELLLHTGVNVNVCNSEGNTPLHLATEDNLEFTVKELLAHPKIDIDIYNKNRRVPMQLVYSGYVPNEYLRYALLKSDVHVIKKIIKMVKIRLNILDNIDIEQSLKLFEFAIGKDETNEILNLLLDNSEDFFKNSENREGVLLSNALNYAVWYNNSYAYDKIMDIHNQYFI